jgi:hypothetical protein
MGSLTLEKKIAQLPADLKLKAEGYVDALLNEYNLKPTDDNISASNEAHQNQVKPRAGFGSMKGLIKYMADDFDAPLDEFKDYM